jgi:predicted CXXCH cytochrome family protein
MKKRSAQFVLLASALALLLVMLAAASVALDVPQKTIETKGVAKKCFACHSYDKIRGATAKYKTSSGETVTPHQYVPHKDKEKGVIPDCTECHKEHSIPVDKSKVVKPKDINFCYNACHHMNNLDPCSKCH